MKPYWDMRYGVPGETNENRLSKELESLFERCVAEHCNNEPLAATGAFLSGGTDSSTVVGMMSRMGKDRSRLSLSDSRNKVLMNWNTPKLRRLNSKRSTLPI